MRYPSNLSSHPGGPLVLQASLVHILDSDVLEVPIIGRPVTTEEVSMKWGDNRNAQKYVTNEKMREYVCMNSF